METVLTNTSASFVTAKNSNNGSNDNAIFTQFRRHCFNIKIPSEVFTKYTGKDVESAIFGFKQTIEHSRVVTNNTYWVFFNSKSTCPFGTGTEESVTTDSTAYPNIESEQCVTSLTTSTSELKSFSVDITKLIAYAIDNVTPSTSDTTSFYIWQRFGISSPRAQNGTITNIGNWTITITMNDGLIFVYTNGEWKIVQSTRMTNGEWKECTASVRTNNEWKKV